MLDISKNKHNKRQTWPERKIYITNHTSYKTADSNDLVNIQKPFYILVTEQKKTIPFWIHITEYSITNIMLMVDDFFQ